MRDPRWVHHATPCRRCGLSHDRPEKGRWAPAACIYFLNDRIIDLEREVRFTKVALEQNRRDVTEISDLRIVVRDQRNHIANLEAQLTPLLRDHQAETEAML
jgi:uncharacterized protein YcbX